MYVVNAEILSHHEDHFVLDAVKIKMCRHGCTIGRGGERWNANMSFVSRFARVTFFSLLVHTRFFWFVSPFGVAENFGDASRRIQKNARLKKHKNIFFIPNPKECQLAEKKCFDKIVITDWFHLQRYEDTRLPCSWMLSFRDENPQQTALVSLWLHFSRDINKNWNISRCLRFQVSHKLLL